MWLTKCFGAGCGKSLARVLLKEAVVVLGCRFCVPRAVNTVFKAKKKSPTRPLALPFYLGVVPRLVHS